MYHKERFSREKINPYVFLKLSIKYILEISLVSFLKNKINIFSRVILS